MPPSTFNGETSVSEMSKEFNESQEERSLLCLYKRPGDKVCEESLNSSMTQDSAIASMFSSVTDID